MIESLLLVLPCAAMMGVMMYMIRGKSDANSQPRDGQRSDRQHEVDALRAEVDELRREHNTTGVEPERG